MASHHDDCTFHNSCSSQTGQPIQEQSRRQQRNQSIKHWDIFIGGVEDAERIQIWLQNDHRQHGDSIVNAPLPLRVRIEVDGRLMENEANQQLLSPIWTLLASNKERFEHFKFGCEGYPFPVDILSTILSGATGLQHCKFSQVLFEGDLSTLSRALQSCQSLQHLELVQVWSDDEPTVDRLLLHLPDRLREITLDQAQLSAEALLAMSSGKNLLNENGHGQDEGSHTSSECLLSNHRDTRMIEKLTFKFCPGITTQDWGHMLVDGMAYHPTCQFLNCSFRPCTETHMTQQHQQQRFTDDDDHTYSSFWWALGEMLQRSTTLKKVWITFHENREAVLSRLEKDLLHLADSLRGNTSLLELHLCIKVPRRYQSEYENERVWDEFAAMLKHDNFVLQFFSMGYYLLGVQSQQSDEVAFYTELNRAGRRFLLSNEKNVTKEHLNNTIPDKVGATRKDWLRVIMTQKDNASIVFYFLVQNPSILIGADIYS